MQQQQQQQQRKKLAVATQNRAAATQNQAPQKAAPQQQQQQQQAEDDFFDEEAAGGDGAGEGGSEEVMDLSDVDENASFDAAPPGVYDAIITDAEYGESKKGKKMITWSLELTAPPHAGKPMWYYTVTSGSGLNRLKKMLVRIAPQLDLKAFAPATTPLELVGTKCRLKVVVQMYQGERRNQVKDVLPAATKKVFDEE